MVPWLPATTVACAQVIICLVPHEDLGGITPQLQRAIKLTHEPAAALIASRILISNPTLLDGRELIGVMTQPPEMVDGPQCALWAAGTYILELLSCTNQSCFLLGIAVLLTMASAVQTDALGKILVQASGTQHHNIGRS